MWILLSIVYIFLSISKFRTKNIINDASIYLDLFEDLDKFVCGARACSLCSKLNIPNIRGCFYRDKLKTIQPNSSYIINLNSELDEHGNRNSGSHWTCLLTDDMKQAIYFNSYGEK